MEKRVHLTQEQWHTERPLHTILTGTLHSSPITLFPCKKYPTCTLEKLVVHTMECKRTAFHTLPQHPITPGLQTFLTHNCQSTPISLLTLATLLLPTLSKSWSSQVVYSTGECWGQAIIRDVLSVRHWGLGDITQGSIARISKILPSSGIVDQTTGKTFRLLAGNPCKIHQRCTYMG